MEATYTKLSNGDWGVRVSGDAVKTPCNVLVRKKSGESKQEMIEHVIWSGNGVSLCAIAKTGASSSRVYDSQKFNGYGARKGGYRKACVSDGNCSSMGSGRSCGGHDCDGH